MYQYTRQGILETLETQRWGAQQAGRDAELDPRSVLLVAKRLLEEGDRSGAESIVAAYRASLKGAQS